MFAFYFLPDNICFFIALYIMLVSYFTTANASFFFHLTKIFLNFATDTCCFLISPAKLLVHSSRTIAVKNSSHTTTVFFSFSAENDCFFYTSPKNGCLPISSRPQQFFISTNILYFLITFYSMTIFISSQITAYFIYQQ